MKLMIMDVIEYTTSDGPGFRTSIYCSGCNHKCRECQNPQTWDIMHGHPVDVEDLFSKIRRNEMSNVTFSGGDPFYQPTAFTELAKMIKEKTDKTIWCYTGFTYEQIIKDAKMSKMLQYIDVLVDGEFIVELKDPDLLFRGSSNQRLIDVQASLKKGEVVLDSYNPYNLYEPQHEENKKIEKKELILI
ncbi:MAG: anaerobic ribonucleoside-triphosphate reductase activating protein [Bacteroidales bacterium]|nr:anaerobic ribonucleoside-triphosphate reductase activating protein [Bacteroidales bacterium]